MIHRYGRSRSRISRQARERIAGTVLRTPLVKLDLGPSADIRLKLENLQPTNAYKIRGATQCGRRAVRRGARARACGRSAPAMRGRASLMRRAQFGIPCTVVAIETAPQTKLDRMRALGATSCRFPTTSPGSPPKRTNSRVSTAPSSIRSTITISSPATARWASRSSRICPDVRTVICAIGGGGLITGVGSAIKALQPEAKVLGAEPETAAPYALVAARGRAAEVHRLAGVVRRRRRRPERHRADVGADAPGYRRRDHRDARPNARGDAADRREVADDRRRGRRAVARRGAHRRGGEGPIVCVVSGGNIDLAKFAELVAS